MRGQRILLIQIDCSCFGYVRLTKTPPALTAITVFEMIHGFENAVVTKAASDRLERDLDYALELTKGCVKHLICGAVATLEVARISIVATRRHFVNPY